MIDLGTGLRGHAARLSLFVAPRRDRTGERGWHRFAQGWRLADRGELLNHIVRTQGVRRYLEIGVHKGELFERIEAADKVGVDPDPMSAATVKLTSDAFFEGNDETFDLIFIDGLHTGEQVARDIENALAALAAGGSILLHDLNPPTAIHARPEYTDSGRYPEWTGTSWEGFARFRKTHPGLEMFTVDVDWGVGVIRRGTQELYDGPIDGYEDLERDRERILNLVPVREFLRRYPRR